MRNDVTVCTVLFTVVRGKTTRSTETKKYYSMLDYTFFF